MSEISPSPRRWSVEQRLQFIDRRLYWDGKINRSDLRSHFSVSTPQASSDLSSYDEAMPGNMAYDPHAKAYLASETFCPRAAPSAREYLTQLQLIADDVLPADASWVGWVPPYDVVPKLRRRLPAETLRAVVSAIRQERSLEIEYQSMRSTEPSKRWIAPHALSFDGSRWHTRAWCFRRERFSDFVLARVLGVHGSRERGALDADLAWEQTTTLCLGPNPKLPPTQQLAVHLDYGMTNGVVEVKVRRSLVYYLARRLLLEFADRLPPECIQVALLNADEVNRDLKEVGESALKV